MITRLRYLSSLTAIAIILKALVYECVASSGPEVSISVNKQLRSDGVYHLDIIERGTDPHGDYSREYSFNVAIENGVAVPIKFQDYLASRKTNIGVWRTSRAPIAGYLFAFRNEGRLFFDVELIELIDHHPERMAINGIRSVTEPKEN